MLIAPSVGDSVLLRVHDSQRYHREKKTEKGDGKA